MKINMAGLISARNLKQYAKILWIFSCYSYFRVLALLGQVTKIVFSTNMFALTDDQTTNFDLCILAIDKRTWTKCVV